jgi:hypothetical protein
LTRESDNDLKATVSMKIGPIAAKFAGKVQLLDLDPLNSYRIEGEGQGGVAGFAKGGAKVALEDDGPGTVLRYEVHAQVGGKIAQLGARLVDATAKQMADQFFDRFSAQVTAMVPAAAETVAVEPAPEAVGTYPLAPSEEVAHLVLSPAYPPPTISVLDLIPPEPFGLPVAAWIGGAVYVLILLLFFGSLL